MKLIDKQGDTLDIKFTPSDFSDSIMNSFDFEYLIKWLEVVSFIFNRTIEKNEFFGILNRMKYYQYRSTLNECEMREIRTINSSNQFVLGSKMFLVNVLWYCN